jgi:triosephosphate isomerase
VIVCPPYTSLLEAYSLLKDTKIKIGAQNMHFESSGAFTGEISASMLKSVGCEYVILGHSERRTIFGETDELINSKIKKANSSGLKPIFCVGELLEEREAGITEKVIEKQIRSGLKEISPEEMGNLIIAYEPVWAIGTGKTASPEQAEEVHKFIRGLINDKYGTSVSDKIVIQYGGSVNNKNARELLSQKDIDGALVGGASLKADAFIEIIQAT